MFTFGAKDIKLLDGYTIPTTSEYACPTITQVIEINRIPFKQVKTSFFVFLGVTVNNAFVLL